MVDQPDSYLKKICPQPSIEIIPSPVIAGANSRHLCFATSILIRSGRTENQRVHLKGVLDRRGIHFWALHVLTPPSVRPHQKDIVHWFCRAKQKMEIRLLPHHVEGFSNQHFLIQAPGPLLQRFSLGLHAPQAIWLSHVLSTRQIHIHQRTTIIANDYALYKYVCVKDTYASSTGQSSVYLQRYPTSFIAVRSKALWFHLHLMKL